MSKKRKNDDKPPIPKPTLLFRGARWVLCVASMSFAIGSLAIYDQYLDKFPITYTGKDPQYSQFVNKTIHIAFCLLSDTRDVSLDGRCNLGYTSAAIGLSIAMFWAFFLGVRRSVISRDFIIKFGDIGINAVGALWWLACAIPISVWTTEANRANLPATNWRNTVSFFAWMQCLLFIGSAALSLVLLSEKLQIKLFTPKPKPDPAAVAAAADASGGAVKAGAAHDPPHTDSAPTSAWPDAGARPSTPPASLAHSQPALPLSTPPASKRGKPGAGAAGDAPDPDNPFRYAGPNAV